MDARYFSRKIVEWYNRNKRNLPWRNTKDPYKIWLSEIILQQTRVNQGLPYYKKFVSEFPTVQALAAAPLQKVLRYWQGLGYYTRARNLHACAKEIVKNHDGVFPETYQELKRLPGIGDYTAAAIASICFNERAAVVDGNVFRVLARVFGVDLPINSSQGKKYFTELANSLISNKPAVHNQALMEFGALHCAPKNPQCETCVLQTGCRAYKLGLQLSLPVKIKNKKSRTRYFYYFVLQKNNALLMRHRNVGDIWHGLYDFYLIEKNRITKPETLIGSDAFLKKIKQQSISTKTSGLYKHQLSHQTILSRFTILQISKKLSPASSFGKFYPLSRIKELPKPVLISRFLQDFQLLKLT